MTGSGSWIIPQVAAHLLGMAALVSLTSASGHHSSTGIFDSDNIVEIEGLVTSTHWRNPHTSFTVEVVDPAGQTVEWYVESGSVSGSRMRGVSSDLIEAGDRIRVAGESSLRGRPEMFARNVLLSDGREVMLRITARPRWPELRTALYEPDSVEESVRAAAAAEADGIFRVWSTVLGDEDSFPMYWDDVGPLTDAAAKAKAEFDPRTSPFLGCHPKGMPYIMITPYPVEFTRAGGDIVIRFEEHDAERLIHMGAPRPTEAVPHSLFGYSTGRWEDGALVVNTERVNAPYFYGDGTPQSDTIRLVERFTVNETEDRLDYRLIVDDRATFAERLEFTRYLAWKPGVEVERYDCVE